MASVDSLLDALDERTIAQEVAIPHDEARMCYALTSNIVGSFSEFSEAIADYYNYHFTTCVSDGGELSPRESASRAKEILEREYRRHQGDIVSAFNDAHDGTNGGLRGVLDKLADALKAESIERYVRDMFDVHVAPNDWDEKVSLIANFMAECGSHLSSSIRRDQPERYAHNYVELVRAYVGALQRTSSLFRRL